MWSTWPRSRSWTRRNAPGRTASGRSGRRSVHGRFHFFERTQSSRAPAPAGGKAGEVAKPARPGREDERRKTGRREDETPITTNIFDGFHFNSFDQRPRGPGPFTE